MTTLTTQAIEAASKVGELADVLAITPSITGAEYFQLKAQLETIKGYISNAEAALRVTPKVPDEA